MNFKPVWISSVNHLQVFEKSYSETSLFRKLIGVYRLPKGVPFLRDWWGLIGRVPLTMYSTGELTINKDRLEYEASIFPPFGWENLKTGWKFSISRDEIISAESYEFNSPMWNYYSLPFIRIRTTLDNELSDFLICIGGKGPFMGHIRDKNKDFAEKFSRKLKEFLPEYL